MKTPPIQLESFWPYQAVVLADKISRFTLATAKAEAGLNLSQWRVLAAVSEKSGRTAAQVAAITPMDKTIISRAVSSLIDSGLIVKTPDGQDKRRFSLTATSAGQKIYIAIAQKLSAALVHNSHEISPEDFTASLKDYTRLIENIRTGDS